MEENVICTGVVTGLGTGGSGSTEENYILSTNGGLCKTSLPPALLMTANTAVGYSITTHGSCGLSTLTVIVRILGAYNTGYVVCTTVHGDVDATAVGGVEKVSMLSGAGGPGVVCVPLICNDNL